MGKDCNEDRRRVIGECQVGWAHKELKATRPGYRLMFKDFLLQLLAAGLRHWYSQPGSRFPEAAFVPRPPPVAGPGLHLYLAASGRKNCPAGSAWASGGQ